MVVSITAEQRLLGREDDKRHVGWRNFGCWIMKFGKKVYILELI